MPRTYHCQRHNTMRSEHPMAVHPFLLELAGCQGHAMLEPCKDTGVAPTCGGGMRDVHSHVGMR